MFVCDNGITMGEKLAGSPMKFKTRGSPLFETKKSDEVIAEIEKFMRECENSSMAPLRLSKGKIYDSDTDLLKILDSDNRTKIRSDHQKIQNQKKVHVFYPIMKRKSTEKHEEPVVKKPTKNVQPVGRNGEILKKRGRPRKSHEAKIRTYVGPKFTLCKVLLPEKKRRIHPVVCHSNKKKPTVLVPIVLCDSRTVRNITVKKEIIDLTEDDNVLFTYLKFAKICTLEEETERETKSLGLERVHAKISVLPNYLHEIKVSIPDVQFHVEEAYIDLTQLDNEAEDDTYVISEKECASRILPIIQKCYVIHQGHKKIEDALEEIRKCLSPEDIEDYMSTFKLISKNTASLGCCLLQTLSRMVVKTLNMSRFLDIVALKLEQKYNIKLTPKRVCFYLFSMLNPNRDFSKSQLALQILEEVEDHLSIKSENEGDVDSKVVFTEQQFDVLRWQIKKYIELSELQEELVKLDQNVELMGLDISKEIKNELLTLNLQDESSSVTVPEIL